MKNPQSRFSILDEEIVRETLTRIARDVEPICREFNFRYGQLGASNNRSLYGFNRGSGKIIRVRLHDLRTGKLRKHSALVVTMLHELCHCRYRTHSQSFYNLLREVVEYAKQIGVYRPDKKRY